MQPLSDVKVLDFSTLLPGPMATLLMAEAGAEVIKIERPPDGDGMRGYPPQVDGHSLFFALLNRGKRTVFIDLKEPAARGGLRGMIEDADVLVEQFRPGVMERLGLGYEAVRATNPRIVYCSVSGYGQHGPKVHKAAHDLNYVAESGLLSLVTDTDGAPRLPPTLIADIAGGAYPAFMNVLLGLMHARKTGSGCHIDVAMNDFVLPFAYIPIGEGLACGYWPKPNGLDITGASPRYNIYRAQDGLFLAAAPLEEHFWTNFCDIIGLSAELRDDARDKAATLAAVRETIAARPSDYWRKRFDGVDACVSIVVTMEEAMADPHFASRGIFSHEVQIGDRRVPATPVPIAAVFRKEPGPVAFPDGSDDATP